MTVVTSGAFALDMDQLDLSSLFSGTITVANSGQITTNGSGIDDNFFGSFQYDASHALAGGTITHFSEYFFGQFVFDIANFNVPALTFVQWAMTGDNLTAKTTLLAGADSLAGSPQGDLLRGYAGDDILAGGAGNDTLDGGSGADTINGNLGDDVITGGDGANYLRGDEGNDLVIGGSGFDDINGNMGNDTAHGGDGNDWVVGGKDNDVLTGDGGDDIVYGNLGNDTVSGDAGNDTVRGGQGDDSLSGGSGNDWLSGDKGNDTISGGQGADIFHTFSGAGLDRVLDFKLSEGDRVQVDLGTTYSVNQVGADTVVDLGNGDQLILVGVSASALAPGWIFSL